MSDFATPTILCQKKKEKKINEEKKIKTQYSQTQVPSKPVHGAVRPVMGGILHHTYRV